MSYFQLRTATFKLPFLIKKSSLKSRHNFGKQVHSVFLGWGWGSESIDCTSIMGCITNNTNFKITNNRSNSVVDIHCMVHLIHWKCGHCGGGGGDNWKTQSNTPGVRKKYRLGQGTETEKVFKN